MKTLYDEKGKVEREDSFLYIITYFFLMVFINEIYACFVPSICSKSRWLVSKLIAKNLPSQKGKPVDEGWLFCPLVFLSSPAFPNKNITKQIKSQLAWNYYCSTTYLVRWIILCGCESWEKMGKESSCSKKRQSVKSTIIVQR